MIFYVFKLFESSFNEYNVPFDFRLDDGQANGGDDQYDGDYEKEQQKNDIHLAEGEDEGEGNLRTIE